HEDPERLRLGAVEDHRRFREQRLRATPGREGCGMQVERATLGEHVLDVFARELEADTVRGDADRGGDLRIIRLAPAEHEPLVGPEPEHVARGRVRLDGEAWLRLTANAHL